jgi:hypothetical protein
MNSMMMMMMMMIIIIIILHIHTRGGGGIQTSPDLRFDDDFKSHLKYEKFV